jgi:methyltransferase-like protein
MGNLKSVPSHSPSIVTRKTGNEYVLVPVANNIADMNSVYTLNETGAFIWEQIDGRKSIEDIIAALLSEFETDERTATEDVLSFLEEMKKYLIIKDLK